MKKFFVTVFICSSMVLVAQTNIKGAGANSYITHKVVPGESLSSVARKYNVDTKAIAALNNFSAEKGLIIGQTIKVPAKGSASTSASAEVSTINTKVNSGNRHIVEKGETLSGIAVKYKISMDDLQRWNKLTNANIAAGTSLIVTGSKPKSKTLSVKTVDIVTPPAVASSNKKVSKANTTLPAETKKEEPVIAESITVEKKQEPVQPPMESNVVKTEAAPANTSTSLSNQPLQQGNAETRNEEKKIDLLTPEPETSNEGVFSELYSIEATQKSLTNKTGDAATFKSSSGWQNKKFYVLIDNVQPGTILKISSVDNKVVFAKVLGSMPEMKENRGLLLRLSNAAASYMGIINPKFPVQVSFYQ
jgi:LysM repeat protein